MTEGKKYDSGKPKAGMVLGYFSNAIMAVADVGTYGNEKYGDGYWDYNWNHLDNAPQRYSDALCRHLLAHLGGELVDSESGRQHMAHVAWNALALIELMQFNQHHTITIEEGMVL
jgi:hypothetical protein